MNYVLNIAKLLTAAALSVGVFGGSDPVQPPPDQEPTSDYSTKHCENHPYPVYCYANYNYPDHSYFNCYSTLCQAVADGSYQCKKATGTCK